MKSNKEMARLWIEQTESKANSLPVGVEKDEYTRIYMVGHYLYKALIDIERQQYIRQLNEGWSNGTGSKETEYRWKTWT